MTTIAYRAGVLAADGRAVQGTTKSRTTKLFKVENLAVGIAGNLAGGLSFLRWLATNQKDDCPLDGETYALVMNLDTGDCEQWESPGVAIPVEDGFAAIGSGAGFAYGAMEMGADAKKAVQVAAKWDVYTGHGVKVIKAKGGK